MRILDDEAIKFRASFSDDASRIITDSFEAVDLRSSLGFYGTDITFEYDIWCCDKKKKSEAHRNKVRISFALIPSVYKDLVKYYSINSLNTNITPNTVDNKVKCAGIFLRFLIENNVDIKKVNTAVRTNFYNMIEDYEHWTETYKYRIWSSINEFLNFVRAWLNKPLPNNLFKKNPFDVNKTNNDEKYIPDKIVSQLDFIFREKEITRYICAFYWIIRSIPSRVTEVAGMKLECLKPYGEDTWVLMIPTWKQNGGYKAEQIRRIYIKYEGHGKFLVDLVRKQQEYAKSLQDKLPDELKGYLFVREQTMFKQMEFKKTGIVKYITLEGKYNLPEKNTIGKELSKICERYNVTDEDNKLYLVTSHQFRHRGITQMGYAGFTPMKIMLITAHQSDAMINKNYHHKQDDILLEKQRKVLSEDTPSEDAPVLFQGKILNMDAKTESRLLKNNARAYRIKNLGICGDITGCKNNIFECLACDYFIPNGDDLEYFKVQVKYWEERVVIFKKNDGLRENAEYNLDLHKKIVHKIESAIKQMG